MQVTCPNCGARYAVDPLAIGPIGRTVQCVRCNHRWREKAAVAAAVQPEPALVPPRPTSDAMTRPPAHDSALPSPKSPPPTATWEGRWLAAGLLLVIVLGIATYIWRDRIWGTLPGDWQTVFNLDAERGLLKK